MVPMILTALVEHVVDSAVLNHRRYIIDVLQRGDTSIQCSHIANYVVDWQEGVRGPRLTCVGLCRQGRYHVHEGVHRHQIFAESAAPHVDNRHRHDA